SWLNVNTCGYQSERMPGSMNPVIGGAARCLGTVSLRSAIQVANTNNGANRITFRIPDSGMAGGPPWSIGINSALPALSDATGGTTVDGSTQLGVEVKRAGAPLNTDGFSITRANNAIIDLTVNNFGGTGAGVL